MTNEPTVAFMFRAPASLIERVDAWRGRQEGVPNRTEAIRRILDAWLNAEKIRSRSSK